MSGTLRSASLRYVGLLPLRLHYDSIVSPGTGCPREDGGADYSKKRVPLYHEKRMDHGSGVAASCRDAGGFAE